MLKATARRNPVVGDLAAEDIFAGLIREDYAQAVIDNLQMATATTLSDFRIFVRKWVKNTALNGYSRSNDPYGTMLPATAKTAVAQ